MGLIRCEQCGYDVSTEATACPHCNTPIVLFQLKDSLSRKKEEFEQHATNKTTDKVDEKLTDTDIEAKPPVDTSKKPSPDIFDTIKKFKEQNIISKDDETDSLKKEKPNEKPSSDHIVKQTKLADHKIETTNKVKTAKKSNDDNVLKQRQAHKKSTVKPETYRKLSKDTPFKSNETLVLQSDTAITEHKISQTTSGISLPGNIIKPTKTKGFNPRLFLLLALLILCIGLGIFVYTRSNSPNTKANDQQAKLEHFNKNRQEIIDEINSQLNLNNYGNAQKIAREYLYINDPDINRMYVKARKEFLMIELSKLRSEWDNYELPDHLPNNNTKIKLFIDIKQHYREKRRIYEELAKIDPDSKEYTEKYKFFSDKYNEIDKKFDELNKRRIVEQKKLERIENQFSRVDGSHINLEKYIKNKMKHPDSYTHIKSAYEDRGNYLIVATTYQGKDIYDQVVIKTVKARVSPDGKVLGIISEY